MLDRLPAWGRHLLIVAGLAPLSIFLGVEATAILTAGGLSHFDLGTSTVVAVDAAAVSFASGILGWLALVVTPLTRQYGVGSDKGAE